MAAKTETLADRLKALRQALSKTQAEIADACGIPLPTWKKYEMGAREPGSSALAAMSVTGVDLHWLLTGTGAMLRSEGLTYSLAKPSLMLKARESGASSVDADLLAAAIAGVDNMERVGRSQLDASQKTAMVVSLYQGALAAKGGN
ncbi:MAG TPA: helix-turn-helix transcriptional regulator [Rhodocyclaceae bacterium]|nr:helix-turn-helix transcriptional regulator [Rhodocyclaceae bacterium]